MVIGYIPIGLGQDLGGILFFLANMALSGYAVYLDTKVNRLRHVNTSSLEKRTGILAALSGAELITIFWLTATGWGHIMANVSIGSTHIAFTLGSPNPLGLPFILAFLFTSIVLFGLADNTIQTFSLVLTAGTYIILGMCIMIGWVHIGLLLPFSWPLW